jgi:hypothetical protein
MSTGQKVHEPSPEERAILAQGWAENRTGNRNELVGDRDFAAMVRVINKIDRSYME